MSLLKLNLLVPLVFALLAGTWLALQADQRKEEMLSERDVYAAPPLSEFTPASLEILTLGYKNLYDLFLNLWLLQALVHEHNPNDSERMITLIDRVIRHSPPYESLYMLSCFVMIEDFNEPEACQNISRQGLLALPESWRIPVTQAYVHAFLLEEPAQAASYFMMAGSRPLAPAWSKRVAKILLQEREITAADYRESLQIIENDPEAKDFFRQFQPTGQQGGP